jgi:hypothetical protein
MRGFYRFLKMNRHKRMNFIFDLDRTLWDFTIEYSPTIKCKDVKQNYIHASRPIILKTLQDEGHILNVASRSKVPNTCCFFLDVVYPEITFLDKQIFYTPEEDKQEHLENILGLNVVYPFYFFDDEKTIMDRAKDKNKLCHGFHTPNGLNFDTFKFFE